MCINGHSNNIAQYVYLLLNPKKYEAANNNINGTAQQMSIIRP